MRLRTLGELCVENSDADPGVGARPRSLALLAILAAAGSTGVSRNRVMAVLWPDLAEERARHALSQTLYNLRRDFHGAIVVAPPTLRLDPERMTSDVADFRAAVAAKEWGAATALYAGPFLDHFHLADAPEFERWAEAERAALATAGTRAIEIVAKASAEAGHHEEAAEHWHRLTRLDPVDSRIAASYMKALAALGDRSAAIAHGRAHGELLRREYDVEPDPAVERLMARLREVESTGTHAVAATATRALASTYAPPAPMSVATPVVEPSTMEPIVEPTANGGTQESGVAPSLTVAGRRPMRLVVDAAAVVVALGVAVVAVVTLARQLVRASPSASLPVLAVGRILDLAAPDSAVQGAVLSEMLATSLGRLAELQVVANSRMVELTPRGAESSRGAFTDAARRAGATEVVEGELIPLGGARLRLEVRRVELAHGLVRGGYRLTGSDRIALFDSVTSLIAADLRVGAPTGSLAEVSTRSPIAYRFYEEGVRALLRDDALTASHLLRAALREDSSFAMATYYAWWAARALGEPDEFPLAYRAMALASRTPPRERLLIITHVGAVLADLRARAAAETLATNYPHDPEALVRAGEVVPDLARAVSLIEASIAIDSAAGPGAVLCRICDALSTLVSRYEWADSGRAALRTLDRWSALRPTDATPWMRRADWLVGVGRRAEADVAQRRYEALGGRSPNAHLYDLVTDLRLDDLASADRACDAALASADTSEFVRNRWYCAIALRMEGRFREARALLREGRVPRSGAVWRGLAPDGYQAAAALMELGQPLAAADEFRAISTRLVADTSTTAAGLRARYTTWALTLAATAAVAGGDTLRARGLVDTIERTGQRSLFRRDPLLHHFVRGLLYATAHADEAAAREYWAALDSPTFGYTRINYELGRTLLALHRPGEAIPVVQGALRGGLEGSNLYATRTEMHELLAQLYDAAGRRDSAAAHYALVERAWRGADPPLRPRYEAARRWLAAH